MQYANTKEIVAYDKDLGTKEIVVYDADLSVLSVFITTIDCGPHDFCCQPTYHWKSLHWRMRTSMVMWKHFGRYCLKAMSLSDALDLSAVETYIRFIGGVHLIKLNNVVWESAESSCMKTERWEAESEGLDWHSLDSWAIVTKHLRTFGRVPAKAGVKMQAIRQSGHCAKISSMLSK
ncbi:hypothetical protein F5141DRAFT_1060901 [Pisolithus sp. B1]|nr:hypothetical protein F5141DRAFT_1060901 [Pisolithus sp. B1]